MQSLTGRALLLAAVLVPMLAACQRTGDLAPISTGLSSGPSSGSVIVARGDSLYAIARRYEVPLRDLIAINNLSPPYVIEPGQRLTLPAARQYIVQKGDTLTGISRMFSVDVAELSRLNNLAPPYKVLVGQPLRLPGGDGTATATATVAAAATEPPAPARRAVVESAPLPPPQPPSSPASPAPQAAPRPAAAPTPAPPASSSAATYQPGQEPRNLAVPERRSDPVPPADSDPESVRPSPAPKAADAPKPTVPAKPAQERAEEPAPAPAASQPETPPSGNGRFLWPVKGKVLSGFGPKPDGTHNDGINIAAGAGTTVYAAEAGTVVYAGNELKGFGNLLLVRHADGWMTAYAHMDKLSAERGARVKRGQAIGTVGQSGTVTSPQLHFEVRKGKTPVDPTGYF